MNKEQVCNFIKAVWSDELAHRIEQNGVLKSLQAEQAQIAFECKKKLVDLAIEYGQLSERVNWKHALCQINVNVPNINDGVHAEIKQLEQRMMLLQTEITTLLFTEYETN